MRKLFKLGSHPINLIFRFLLEIIALLVVALWAWTSFDGWLGLVAAFVVPFGLALIWGTFTVPEDPSRSGKSPVPIPGALRLLLELLIFSFSAWCLYAMGMSSLTRILVLLVFFHYLISMDRIRWLIKKSPAEEAGDY